jgi:hypothetical protein
MNKTMRLSLLSLFLLLWTNAHSQTPPRLLEFTGTVTYIEVEGGFYGIITDQGEKFKPLFLDDLLKQEGLRVRVTAVLRPNMMGFHQWGHYIVPLHIIPSACLDVMREIGDN